MDALQMSKPAELYACLYAREFPAQALLRLKPESHNKPCVVMDGASPLQYVCSLNTKARLLGIRRNMTRVEVDTFPAYGPWLVQGDWWNQKLWALEQWDLGRANSGWLDALLLHDARSYAIDGRWRPSMTERYIELHTASAFSFLEGASQPEKLVERAIRLEMPAMALLDRNGFYGAARFHTSAKRNDICAHVGAEISRRV